MKKFIDNNAFDKQLSNLIFHLRYTDSYVLLPLKTKLCAEIISIFSITTIKNRTKKGHGNYFAVLIINYILPHIRGIKTAHQPT